MQDVIASARQLFTNPPNTGHGLRPVGDDQTILNELQLSFKSGKAVAAESLQYIQGNSLQVLEVGCSWGPVCLGAASSERVASVIGIEPEPGIVCLAQDVLNSSLLDSRITAKVAVLQGIAEKLTFPDCKFDLIICHTTIEHVRSVEQSIQEMYRVLKPAGVLHLVAPNYIWPYEPHLKLWSLPMGPKWLVKLLARVLRGKPPAFVDELQYVNPIWLEQIFARNSIPYSNKYLDKLRGILQQGQYARIQSLKGLLPALRLLNKLRINNSVFWLASKLSLYPSCDYLIRKPE